ncbi:MULTISPECIES: hypothetical protein [unclassified Polynucleobacter]|jgi:hypothetical protein|uniref:hypothetical protein n=1 Tax=unclassified Polynucleobacter TaxID=2640945 RepID=UPI000929B1DF|nr:MULTISPECIES: hypothetical protein [unclassified Polynucleobacter]MBU3562941.1 hypothetical protein [Polynucleobacter sp. Tro8-14-1]MBU3603100.1 hypothetical protein [Polynucleobacter sp. AP-Kaivos-20-H2]OJI05757.1 hypothetical protein AOC28_02155 [Polynucleobacter sp. MWH-Adler-W8]
MKKTLLAAVTISVAAFAYANTSPSDSSELVNQQCKISAEAVSTLKGLRYGNTAIRKDVSTLINASLKTPENRELAQKTLNLMVDDKTADTRGLEGKYCS